MSFAVPAALALAAIALPIIALYVLKVRLRRVQVSTNLFWKQVYEDRAPRAWWQNLRHLLSLFAQLLLLLLIVLAIADPYFAWQAQRARRIVLVMDTSASMKASDVSPSRFEAARTEAHRLLDGLRVGDQVAVVTASHQPSVALGLANHTPTLRRAINGLQPADTQSSLSAAITLAKQLIGDHPHGQIVVFSDGCNPPLPENDTSPPSPTLESPHPAVQVAYQTHATGAGNVGITQFQARRSLIDPLGYEVLVTVRNASDRTIKGRLELELEQVPVDVLPYQLKPDEKWTRSLEKTSLAGGVLQGRLTQLAADDSQSSLDDSPINALPTDDLAWAIVPERQVQNVLIVTPGNLFLRKVFEANPLVNLTLVNELPSQWPADSLVVLHRLTPEKLPGGQVLVVDPETDSEAWTLGEPIENPLITEQDEASPLMTHIRLDNVLLPQTRAIEFHGPATPLAATVTGESVYAALNREVGPCLVLCVNLERSDLAFRTAFPILITNALGWFAGQPGELQPSLAGGQLTRLQASAISGGLSLISPMGEVRAVVSEQLGPLDTVGVWSVVPSTPVAENGDSTSSPAATPVAAAETVQRLAVNLASPDETDLRPRSDGGPASASASPLAAGWLSRPLWYYLVAAASLVCTLEWYLYQRRLIS